MRRASMYVLIVFLAILTVGPLSAEETPKASQTRAVQGTVTDEDGGKLNFSIPEGGGIRLKKKGDATTYRLVPQKLTDGQVTFSILDAESNQVREAIKLGLDGQTKAGVATPFSLSLSGIETKTMQRCASSAAETNANGGGTEAECCIYDCGVWEYFCCEPSAGWCCTLECVNGNGDLVGDSCSACTAQ